MMSASLLIDFIYILITIFFLLEFHIMYIMCILEVLISILFSSFISQKLSFPTIIPFYFY